MQCVLSIVRVFHTGFLLMGTVAMASAATAEEPRSADEIMAQVAINQDRGQHERSAFVYRQNIVIRLRDSHNKLLREEVSDYQVMPAEERTNKELVSFTGRYHKGKEMVSYGKDEKLNDGGLGEADAQLARELRDDLISDKKSKDGLSPELFPLTAKEQLKYRFTLKGEEAYQGTSVYRIAFEPKPKMENDSAWKGEALISKAELQPMLVTTKLAHGIPLLVRTALGTNFQGLGFSVEYRKFDEGVWFPVSYGTEFRFHVLFFYSRQIAVSMVNSDFRRADVKSSVEFETTQ